MITFEDFQNKTELENFQLKNKNIEIINIETVNINNINYIRLYFKQPLSINS